jgi:hypothetical protein
MNCASISGLEQVSACSDCTEGSPDSAAPSNAEESSVVDPGEPDTGDDATPDSTTPPEDDSDDAQVPEMGLDAMIDAETQRDAQSVRDAAPDVKDAGAHDASSGGVDAGAEAATCNVESCPNGCCTDAGLCAGGGLTAACGMGGAACQNCASFDLVCSASACVTPVADAGSTGPPACMPTTCSNLCVPYFVQCCKSDQSCGCALLFPPGSCN